MVDTTSLNYLPEVAGWEPIPRLEDGMFPTGGAVDPANDSGIMNWQAQLLARRTLQLRDRLDAMVVRAPVLVTVGTGGDFATINAALAYLSDRRPAYVSGGVSCEIRLLAGHVITEQVLVSGANLGWIRLTAESATTLIDRAALTTAFALGYPAFATRNGGYLPTIALLMSMTTGGLGTDRHGISVSAGGGATVLAGCGVRSAGGVGAFAFESGTLLANGADFRSAGQAGIRALGGTRLACEAAVLRSCGTYGLEASNGASVHARGIECQGSIAGGIVSSQGANVNAAGATARTGAADAATDITVNAGGMVNAVSATGGSSQPPNVPTAAGLIFK